VRVTIAVPASFERSTAEENDGDDGDEQHVAYRSRDGIYAIDVRTWTDDEGRPPLQAAAEWIDGWRENTDFTDVRGDFGESQFQDPPASMASSCTRMCWRTWRSTTPRSPEKVVTNG
jgi:hypothetical protein